MSSSDFIIPIEFVKDKYKIKQDTSTDLELTNGENPLYQKIFNADDDFKKLIIPQQSSWYTTDVKYLIDTQKLLQNEIPDLPGHFDIMKFYSTEIKPDDFRDKYNYIGWDKLEFINKSSEALKYMSIYNISSPVLSLALPIIMMMIPFFMIRLQDNSFTWELYYKCLQQVLRNHSLGQIFYFGSASLDKKIMIVMSLLFYIVQVYFNTQSCMKFLKNMIEIHHHIFCINEYITSTITSFNHIEKHWKEYTTYHQFLDKCSDVSIKASSICKELGKISQLKLSFAKMGDVGKAMRAYYMINTDKEWKDTIKYCIYFNSYIHSMKCLKEKLGTTLKCCRYGKTTTFKQIVYPLIDTSEAIGNDVSLDKNIIITGPNAAGKTTIIKSVMINIILCQQYGCGYFKSAKINPYHVLSSYINIPDTSGRDSLFQAEASRCKAILDDIESDANIRHLCIFDELFSGTNPYEAISAATAYLKCIGERENIKFVLTTHFLDLCKRLDTNNNVKNMQMQVHEDKDVGFKYTYKMINGISSVKGGIKVLRDLGYPECIIKESASIIAELKL